MKTGKMKNVEKGCSKAVLGAVVMKAEKEGVDRCGILI